MAVSKPAPQGKGSGGKGNSGRPETARARGNTGKSTTKPPARRPAAGSGVPRVLWGVIGLVVIAVIVIVLVAVTGGSPTAAGNSSMPASVVNAVTTVPQSALTKVGIGSGTGLAAVGQLPIPLTGQPSLTSGGKPEVFFAGAEYCPFCAAERWAMVNAFSRFGTWSGLGKTYSNPTDVYPNTHTFDFLHATYTSQYITLVTVEMENNTDTAALQTPTKAENALINKYDNEPYVSQSGSIPFIDFANKYMQSGANYNPGILSGMSWETIASAMQLPGTTQAKAILASANFLTAAICSVTGDQPAKVCNQPYIAAAIGAMQSAAKSSSSSNGNSTPGAA